MTREENSNSSLLHITKYRGRDSGLMSRPTTMNETILRSDHSIIKAGRGLPLPSLFLSSIVYI